MKIETKFNIGDKVEYSNVIPELEVQPIEGKGTIWRIHISYGNKIHYSIYDSINCLIRTFIPEENIKDIKEELGIK